MEKKLLKTNYNKKNKIFIRIIIKLFFVITYYYFNNYHKLLLDYKIKYNAI